MKTNFILNKNMECLINPNLADFEVVERKFRGHPDSLADMVAQRFSQLYIKKSWEIFPELDSKVFPNFSADKITLSGASTNITDNGYTVDKPIDALLIGKLTRYVGDTEINIENIFQTAIDEILERALNCNDFKQYIRKTVYSVNQAGVDHKNSFYRPTSVFDLLNTISEESVANDTVYVVAYAPLSLVEELTIKLDNFTASDDFKRKFPEIGSDIKTIIRRRNGDFDITLCLPYIPTNGIDNAKYELVIKNAKTYIEEYIVKTLKESKILFNRLNLQVNTKDTVDKKYYAIWGTSLSKGDIGAVGRGNRQQGFISGLRPSTNEAFSGKNPNHFAGVVYQNMAERIAFTIYNQLGVKNIVYITANNGDPLASPQSIDIVSETPIDEKKISSIIEMAITKIQEDKFNFIMGDVYSSYMGNKKYE